MKNMLLVATVFILAIGCRDELNIPEYDSYIDGDGPTFELISPIKDTVYSNQNFIDIHIVCKDNYKLANFEFDIQPTDGSLAGLNYTIDVADSIYTYRANYAVPKQDTTMRYEVYVQATDAVGNVEDELYFITTK